MRDYDKEPIVLDDYNASFAWYVFKYTGIPLLFFVIFVYPLITGNEIKSSFISLFIITLPMINMYNQAKKRKIILSQNKIEYVDSEDKLSIIDLNIPNTFKKSFQNYYYKKQNLHFFYFVFIFFFIGFLMKSLVYGTLLIMGAILTTFVLNTITKYILSDRGPLLFSSVLVQQGEDVIAIPLFKKKEQEEVWKYLILRGVNIQTLPVFFKPFYGIEEAFRGFNIFSSSSKKDILCTECRKSIGNEKFSCSNCGNPLTNQKMIETIVDKKYQIKAILKNKNDFVGIKELLRLQYKPLGYNISDMDKEDSIMLESESNTQSYIYAKRQNHELVVEAFNAVKPTIKADAQEYLIQ